MGGGLGTLRDPKMYPECTERAPKPPMGTPECQHGEKWHPEPPGDPKMLQMCPKIHLGDPNVSLGGRGCHQMAARATWGPQNVPKMLQMCPKILHGDPKVSSGGTVVTKGGPGTLRDPKMYPECTERAPKPPMGTPKCH